MNDEQGRMDGNAQAPALGCKPDQPPSAGQQLLQEGLLLLEQGDRIAEVHRIAGEPVRPMHNEHGSQRRPDRADRGTGAPEQDLGPTVDGKARHYQHETSLRQDSRGLKSSGQ